METFLGKAAVLDQSAAGHAMVSVGLSYGPFALDMVVGWWGEQGKGTGPETVYRGRSMKWCVRRDPVSIPCYALQGPRAGEAIGTMLNSNGDLRELNLEWNQLRNEVVPVPLPTPTAIGAWHAGQAFQRG